MTGDWLESWWWWSGDKKWRGGSHSPTLLFPTTPLGYSTYQWVHCNGSQAHIKQQDKKFRIDWKIKKYWAKLRKRQSVAFCPLPSSPGLYSALCSLPKQKINCALAKTRRNSPSNSPKSYTDTHMGSLPKLFRANCRLVWEADQSRSLAARDGTFLLQLPPPLWEEATHIDFHRSWQGLSFVVACSVVLWLWRGVGRSGEVFAGIATPSWDLIPPTISFPDLAIGFF